MRQRVYIFAVVLCFAVSITAQKSEPLRSITVVTEPNSTVWINDVSYGKTDESGRLALKTAAGGTQKIRIRANGFKETTQNLLPTQKGDVSVALVKTTDEAELAFQQAEAETDKEKAVKLYEKAVRLRPKYAEAYLGMARARLDSNDTARALKAIQAARRARPAYAEASAVEGRIHKTDEDEEKAIAAFKRAIAEGKGFQPEAFTGLGLLYKERAANFGSDGDFESERASYLEAAKYLISAVKQLGGAPDAVIVYQLLGDAYERAKMYREAIQVYEEFLQKFPDNSEASAVRSFIVQLQKRMKEEQ